MRKNARPARMKAPATDPIITPAMAPPLSPPWPSAVVAFGDVLLVLLLLAEYPNSWAICGVLNPPEGAFIDAPPCALRQGTKVSRQVSTSNRNGLLTCRQPRDRSDPGLRTAEQRHCTHFPRPANSGHISRRSSFPSRSHAGVRGCRRHQP